MKRSQPKSQNLPKSMLHTLLEYFLICVGLGQQKSLRQDYPVLSAHAPVDAAL